MQDWIVFRLAEFYLNYAEAVNEYYGPDGRVEGARYTAVEALNVIRNRGGLRDLNEEESKDDLSFRAQVRRERAVELFAEGQRFFDCRRWKIADEKFGQQLHTLRYVQNASKTGYDSTTWHCTTNGHGRKPCICIPSPGRGRQGVSATESRLLTDHV